ncbi:SDR family NAD(P)-dependent oxidoreductase [Amycolatopsis sp. NPDC004378]
MLVAGATGVLGKAIVRELAARGARLAVTGRDHARLASLADEVGAHAEVFEAYDVDNASSVVRRSADALGGLDVALVAFGVVAFGPADRTADAVTEHLFAVNALAPIAFLRAALPLLDRGGAIGAITGVVSDRPVPGMAAYSASKTALSAWLTATRVENRKRGVHVVDARLPHMDTGLADRAVAGEAPRLPRGADIDEVIGRVLDALSAGEPEVR